MVTNGLVLRTFDTRSLGGDTVRSLCFSPRGQVLAVAKGSSSEKEGAVSLFDVESGTEMCSLGVFDADVKDIAYSRTGKVIAAISGRTGGPMRLSIWDVDSGELVREYDGTKFSRVAFCSDDSHVVLNKWEYRRVGLRMLSLVDGDIIGDFSAPDIISSNCLAVSPDGAMIALHPYAVNSGVLSGNVR